jgi:hypothetical protein
MRDSLMDDDDDDCEAGVKMMSANFIRSIIIYKILRSLYQQVPPLYLGPAFFFSCMLKIWGTLLLLLPVKGISNLVVQCHCSVAQSTNFFSHHGSEVRSDE